MVEKEMKFLVDKNKFQKMLTLVETMYPDAVKKEIVQTNHYYDTTDLFLVQNDMTLRVREIDNKFCMQLKTNKLIKNGVRIAEEKEKVLQSLPKNISGNAVGFNEHYCFNNLGFLKTNRIRFKLYDGTNIDFDTNCYLEVIDYEIEIEIEGQAPHKLLSQIKTQNSTSTGKYLRFVRRLNSISDDKIKQ